jgi:hypothetical protein
VQREKRLYCRHSFMKDGWIQTPHEMDRCWCKCGVDEHAYRSETTLADSEGEASLSIDCHNCNRRLREAARTAMNVLEHNASESDAERVAQHLEQTLGAFGIFRSDAEPQ